MKIKSLDRVLYALYIFKQRAYMCFFLELGSFVSFYLRGLQAFIYLNIILGAFLIDN